MKRVFIFFVFAMLFASAYADSLQFPSVKNPTHIDWVKKGGSPGTVKRSLGEVDASVFITDGELLMRFGSSVGSASVEVYRPDGEVVFANIETATGDAVVMLGEAVEGDYYIVLEMATAEYEGFFTL